MRDAEGDECSSVLKRNAAVDLYGYVRMLSAKCSDFLKSARVEGLPLAPDAFDAHELHVLDLVDARFNECKIAHRIQRTAERNKTIFMPRSSGREKPRQIGSTLGMKGEARDAKREPIVDRVKNVKTHQVNFIRDAIELWKHVATRNHVSQFHRCAVGPRSGGCKSSIDHVNLYSIHRGNFGQERKLLFEIFAGRWKHCWNDEAHKIIQNGTHFPFPTRNPGIVQLGSD